MAFFLQAATSARHSARPFVCIAGVSPTATTLGLCSFPALEADASEALLNCSSGKHLLMAFLKAFYSAFEGPRMDCNGPVKVSFKELLWRSSFVSLIAPS